MKASELIARLQQFDPTWEVRMLRGDGDTCRFIQRVEPACCDALAPWLVCSVGEPCTAVGDDDQEVDNDCVMLVGS